MHWKVFKTEEEYKVAVKRSMEIFHAEEGAPEDEELSLLLVLIKDYEDKNIKLPGIDPIEVLKLRMKERQLKSKDLEPFIGSKGHVSSILARRREITLDTARMLYQHLQIPAEVFFMSTSPKKKKEKILPFKKRKN